ncbi:MAG: hypothetical protein RR437_00145 [Clostridium sp.]
MEIIFIFFLCTFLALLCYRKYRSLGAMLLLMLLLILILINPSISIKAAKDGVNLWLFIVIPSLLPFFIINDMLTSLKVPENIGILFSPIARRLFKTSGYGAYAFIMSIFAGYPSGARIVASLYEEGKITKKEGEKILTFSSTSGPLFIIGAVGSGMMLSPSAGYIIFIAHILGAIINGIFSNLFYKRPPKNISLSKFGLNKINDDIISKGIKSSLVTCGFIGGYIVLFCVIVALLDEIKLFTYISSLIESVGVFSSTTINNIVLLLESIVEVSNGSNIISSSSTDFESKLILLSFLIAFSGLAVIGQVSSILSKHKFNMKTYLVFKITHGIFSSFVCFALLKFNLIPVETFTSNDPSSIGILLPLIEILLIILLVFNTLGYIIRKAKQDSLI